MVGVEVSLSSQRAGPANGGDDRGIADKLSDDRSLFVRVRSIVPLTDQSTLQ